MAYHQLTTLNDFVPRKLHLATPCVRKIVLKKIFTSKAAGADIRAVQLGSQIAGCKSGQLEQKKKWSNGTLSNISNCLSAPKYL